MNTKRLISVALGGLMLVFPAYLAAQQDQGQESVADAARKARAEKKDGPKPKMVIDNDNLGSLTGTINVVGEAPAAPDDQAKKAGDDKGGKSGEPAKDESYWRARFDDAHKKLDSDQHDLDIMQREYNLKQQQYYADPMAALKQEYSRQDLNDSKAKIEDKTAAVAKDKSDISDLEDQLHRAGGDAGWASGGPSQSAPAPAQQAPAPAPQP